MSRRAPRIIRLSSVVVLVSLAAAVIVATAPPPASARSVAGPPEAGERLPPDTLSLNPPRIALAGPGIVALAADAERVNALAVLDPRLADRTADMAERSERWARALTLLEEHGFPVLIGSVVQVERRLPRLKHFRYDGSGAAWIFSDPRGRPVAAAVMINLPKLVIWNRVTGGSDDRLRRMIEMHLAHEVYGHVLPVVVSGEVDHPCRFDPDPDASPRAQLEACVMERERELLMELGYEPRESYAWDFWREEILPAGQGG